MGWKAPSMRQRIFKYVRCFTVASGCIYLGYEFGSFSVTHPLPLQYPSLPGCQLKAVARYPGNDGRDMATMLQRDCDAGEHIAYFLRLDIHARRPDEPGYFDNDIGYWQVIELENDDDPVRG